MISRYSIILIAGITGYYMLHKFNISLSQIAPVTGVVCVICFQIAVAVLVYGIVRLVLFKAVGNIEKRVIVGRGKDKSVTKAETVKITQGQAIIAFGVGMVLSGITNYTADLLFGTFAILIGVVMVKLWRLYFIILDTR